MNWFVVFAFFAAASVVAFLFFGWVTRESYGRDADAPAVLTFVSLLAAVLWTGLALGAHFA